MHIINYNLLNPTKKMDVVGKVEKQIEESWICSNNNKVYHS